MEKPESRKTTDLHPKFWTAALFISVIELHDRMVNVPKTLRCSRPKLVRRASFALLRLPMLHYRIPLVQSHCRSLILLQALCCGTTAPRRLTLGCTRLTWVPCWKTGPRLAPSGPSFTPWGLSRAQRRWRLCKQRDTSAHRSVIWTPLTSRINVLW